MSYADTFAFPVSTVDGYTQAGLSMREHFAALALQGILARREATKTTTYAGPTGLTKTTVDDSGSVVREAIRCADALIAELEKSA